MIPKYTVGILSSYLGGYYHQAVIQAIQEEARRQNIRVITVRTSESLSTPPVAAGHVDGWISVLDTSKQGLRSYLQHLRKPIVSIAYQLHDVLGGLVCSNNRQGAYEATEHLINHGHRDILFVGYTPIPDIKLRLEGYREALLKHGIPYREEYIFQPGSYGVNGGVEAGQYLIENQMPCTAVLACSDLNAVGFMDYCRETGKRIPEDYAVIGYDNTSAAGMASPTLTTVDQSIPEMGRMAVNEIIQMIRNGMRPQRVQYVDASLQIRESCGCRKEWQEVVRLPRMSEQMLQDNLARNLEIHKMLLPNKKTSLKDLFWFAAPYFNWGCMGVWNYDEQGNPKLIINEYVDFVSRIEFSDVMSMQPDKFPPMEISLFNKNSRPADAVYIMPIQAGKHHNSVLAMVSSIDPLTDPDRFQLLIQHLDLLAVALEQGAMAEELAVAFAEQDEHRDHLHILQKIVTDGTWDWHIASGAVRVNQVLKDMVHETQYENVISRERFLEFVHPHDLPKVFEVIEEHLNRGRGFAGDLRLRSVAGKTIWTHVRMEASYDQKGQPIRIIGTVRDLSERKKAEERIRYMKSHDSLTGLPHRSSIYDVLRAQIVQHPEQRLAIIVMDLDRFKMINDSYGHEMGDRLLQDMAHRVLPLLRKEKDIARFGGDEYVFFLQFDHEQEIEALATQIMLTVSAPFEYTEHTFVITSSVGISQYPLDGTDPDTLIKNADIAMFRAKQSGKNKYELFSSHMVEQAMWRFNTENQLKKAIKQNRFVLYYQPQVSLASGKLTGAEALIRWIAPEGIVSPSDFIPLAEEAGLIFEIGEWVLNEACRQVKEWLDEGKDPQRISVNISSKQLRHKGFVQMVLETISKHGIAPKHVCLELTETTVIEDLETTIAMLQELSEAGVQIALDDFGTGYSSLSILKKLPLQILKIDKSFIKELSPQSNDADIVAAIISMSKNLNLQVVAEGVERMQQRDFLRERNCEYIQGYFISPPLPALLFSQLMLG